MSPLNFVEKSFKHSETGMTLLMCPWPPKISGYDLNLGPEIPDTREGGGRAQVRDQRPLRILCADNGQAFSRVAHFRKPKPLYSVHGCSNFPICIG